MSRIRVKKREMEVRIMGIFASGVMFEWGAFEYGVRRRYI